MDADEFKAVIREKGRELYRDMPWRRDTRPYYVLVSELMLQQTQVSRVIPKFDAFIKRFPDIKSLADASLVEVIAMWSGLGYNRRARYLHEAARQVVAEHGGDLPPDYRQLLNFQGVGPGTAGAICVYAFNQPVVFIETNVRTVYFYHFFEGRNKVRDAELVPFVEATLDQANPREFYWALMDYGSWLKQVVGKGTNAQSLHYKKQSKFKGSVREMRGQILRRLAEGDASEATLQQLLGEDERFKPALEGLLRDGLVAKTGALFHVAR